MVSFSLGRTFPDFGEEPVPRNGSQERGGNSEVLMPWIPGFQPGLRSNGFLAFGLRVSGSPSTQTGIACNCNKATGEICCAIHPESFR